MIVIEDDLPNDFQPVIKRMKCQEQDQKPETQNYPSNNEPATDCLICFEPCSSNGPHQLVALPCGHLLGKECIVRWINGAKKNVPRGCPSCKKPVNLKRIIPLYCQHVGVIDSAERDRVLEKYDLSCKELARVAASHKNIEDKLNQANLIKRAYEIEAEQVKGELFTLKALLETEREVARTAALNLSKEDGSVSVINEKASRASAQLWSSFDLESFGQGIRIIEFSKRSSVLLAGHLGPNNQYGISQVHIDSPSHRVFMRYSLVLIFSVHSQTIRDLRSSPHEPLQSLTTSLDKTVGLISHLSNSLIHQFQLDAPGWQCCFNPIDPFLIYAGTSQNKLFTFDTRAPSVPLSVVSVASHKGRGIHSLQMTSTTVIGASCDGLFDADGILNRAPLDHVLTDMHYGRQESLIISYRSPIPHLIQSTFDDPYTPINSCPLESATIFHKSRILNTESGSFICVAGSGIFSMLNPSQEHLSINLETFTSRTNDDGEMCFAGVSGNCVKVYNLINVQ